MATRAKTAKTAAPEYNPRTQLTSHLASAHGIQPEGRPPLTELAALDPCARQPAPVAGAGELGRDAYGYRVCRNRDGMDMLLTECCGATAKGCDGYIGCRSCYRPIDELIGSRPDAPYIAPDGHVTATEVMGWGR